MQEPSRKQKVGAGEAPQTKTVEPEREIDRPPLYVGTSAYIYRQPFATPEFNQVY